MEGARCLDLFAGSGALGLEALSRGAAQLTFIDLSSTATRFLETNLQRLNCENAKVIQDDSLIWLKNAATKRNERFDIVFIDPPFEDGLVTKSCEILEKSGIMTPRSMIYVEHKVNQSPIFPLSWHQYRTKRAGNVCYSLFEHE